MEVELRDLCLQANAINLNLIVAQNSHEKWTQLNKELDEIEVQLKDLQDKLTSEESLLKAGLVSSLNVEYAINRLFIVSSQ